MKTPEQHKQEALRSLEAAYAAMRHAQNELAPVQGEGMAEIYSKIGDVYADEISPLIDRLERAKPTGLSNI